MSTRFRGALPSLPRNKQQLGALRDPGAEPLRPCSRRITIREDRSTGRVSVPSHSKASQRRRRLKRGVARWDFDRQLCAEPTRRICTVTLTVPETDARASIGRVMAFWKKVRQTWLGTRYFCWLELQKEGRIHYHCVWLNPPHLRRVNLLAWVDRAWGAGRTQVRFSDGRAGLQRELDYALKYTDKMTRKAYQQKYDEVPRELRTFMSQRLEIPPRVVDEHLTRDVYEYHAAGLQLLELKPGHSELVSEYLVYSHTEEHAVPPGGRCAALEHRRSTGVRRKAWDDPPEMDVSSCAVTSTWRGEGRT